MNLAFIKKHPIFTLCLGVTVLLLIGAGAGLFLSERLYARQALALDAVTTRLQQLYRRDPFPAAANVQKEAENLKDVVDRYNELNELLRTGQVNLQPMKAVDFMQFREKSLRKLRDRLQNARIKFPEKYAFGFDKYEGGQMPAPGDVPRLVQQLKIVEALCDILQEAGITELMALERDNFEQAARGADASGGRRGSPGAPSPEAAGSLPGGDKLVSSQHFKITVKARENAVITMLNLLASRSTFMVVTRIEMNNPRQEYSTGGPVPAPAVAARAPGAPEPVARERPIIMGREELDVKLGLDVYQFAQSLSFKGGGKK
ncbi:MAG: Amuc_1100 family pilus-like protein [Kiritimatiellota bacterium]|nr:Amuc_1100 family pilus-like protein [Kiritimatiellota bacterium]